MSDLFVLAGSYSTTPQIGFPSGVASIPAPIDEQVVLTKKHYDTISLDVDGPVAVQFGGVVNAHVVMLKVIGSGIKVRYTSAAGALQAFPVDTWHSNISRTSPITAIDLQRTPGVPTSVDILLGQITP